MYPSDEKLRINDYGTILLGFVTKPSLKRQSSNKMMEINNLSIKSMVRLHPQPLVEDLAYHMQRKQTKLKIKH
jgi:hypothetical protein